MASNSAMTRMTKAHAPSPINCLPNKLLLKIFALSTIGTNGTYFPFLVATICHHWHSLSINNAGLWTSLTLTPMAEVPPLSSDSPSDPRAIFPRLSLILERSANRDIDFSILPYGERADSFTDAHFAVLSSLLTKHAHRIRSFNAKAHNWPELTCLCKELAFVEMPRLEKWIVVSNVDLVYEDKYDEAHPVDDISVLGYVFDSGSKPVPTHELKWSGTHLYPALTGVIIIGVPVAWSHFSASNLRKLVLEKYPLDHRMMMQTLHGILSNSKDTLESLTLNWAVASEVDWARNRLLLKHLTLPRVNDLGMGYIDAQEACQVFQTFEFPALYKLKLRSLDEGIDSSTILIDMMKYLPLEQLEKLDLLKIRFPPGGFPNRNLVKNGSIAEESLPLLLQFIRRLVRVHELGISTCSDTHTLVIV
ncbi:hypothetical protein IW261DRAFT_1628758 [Armillaria novae-zelandiae]|uniref:F-box domain-containing protein n=1 Tax=Armillaria novae-zelandiae TaxID=153914 RepID=A0AA39NAP9_9AGAR|nr:hypothetical protein IW261DRAFT_1628758 [Armillaria novae-zelandiae]